MAYIQIDNFSGGLDDRKSILTSAPGTLAYLNNAHLTAGGEIEKRKAFHPVYVFPPNVRCLGGRAGVGTVWLFGNGSRPPSLPAEFSWVNVRVGNTNAIRLLRVDFWGREPRALLEYPNGVRRWFANTSVVDTSDPEVWGWPAIDPNRTNDLLVSNRKLWTVQGSILEASGLNEPEKHGSDVLGSTFYDASHEGPGISEFVAIAKYLQHVVTFAKNAAVIWQVDPDPDATAPIQTIENFGCAAPRSIVNYGESDTFFLSYSGVRSVRARDSSNIATVADVGTPINKTIGAHLSLLLETNNVATAIGVYEPRDGRYWLSLFDVIYVLSYFPSAKVTAWSTYTPGFQVVDMFNWDQHLFVLSPNTLYSFGAYKGNASDDYDNTVVEVETPFMNANDPAGMKRWFGYDMAAEGKWTVHAATNVRDPSFDEITQNLVGPTYDDLNIDMVGESTHVKLRLRSEHNGYARLSSVAVHFEPVA